MEKELQKTSGQDFMVTEIAFEQEQGNGNRMASVQTETDGNKSVDLDMRDNLEVVFAKKPLIQRSPAGRRYSWAEGFLTAEDEDINKDIGKESTPTVEWEVGGMKEPYWDATPIQHEAIQEMDSVIIVEEDNMMNKRDRSKESETSYIQETKKIKTEDDKTTQRREESIRRENNRKKCMANEEHMLRKLSEHLVDMDKVVHSKPAEGNLDTRQTLANVHRALTSYRKARNTARYVTERNFSKHLAATAEVSIEWHQQMMDAQKEEIRREIQKEFEEKEKKEEERRQNDQIEMFDTQTLEIRRKLQKEYEEKEKEEEERRCKDQMKRETDYNKLFGEVKKVVAELNEQIDMHTITKKEIKSAVKALNNRVCRTENCYKAMKMGRIKKTANKETQTIVDSVDKGNECKLALNAGTQTDDILEINQNKIEYILYEEIDKITTYEDFERLARKQWSKECFTVIHSEASENIEKSDENTLVLSADEGIGETHFGNCEEGVYTITTQKAGLTDKERKRYYIIQYQREADGRPKPRSIFSRLQDLKTLLLESSVKKFYTSKIGCGRKKLDWGYVKKMYETVFRNTGIEVLVGAKNDTVKNNNKHTNKQKISTKEGEMNAKAETAAWTEVTRNPTSKLHVNGKGVVPTEEKRREKKTRKNRPDAILIETRGSTYSEVVREMKNKIDPGEIGLKFTSMRKTRDGKVLLELEKGCNVDEGRRKALEEVLGGDRNARILCKDTRRATLVVKGIEEETGVEEVLRDISKNMDEEGKKEIKIKAIRKAHRGSNTAIVELREKEAEGLVKDGS